jgi:hypothetical protein
MNNITRLSTLLLPGKNAYLRRRNTKNGMKRTFLFSLAAFVALYAKITYDIRTEDALLTGRTKGYLSEIAQRVTAIPLQTGAYEIEQTRAIRREGNSLFLISNDILYRFHADGQFVCRITDPSLIRVGTYLVDPLRRRLIVLGNTDDIHYYTFEGQLVEQKKAGLHNGLRRMQAVALYRDCIWTVEERACSGPLTQETYIERQLVKYDFSFQEMESHRLLTAGLPDQPLIPFFGDIHIAVAEDTGAIYAYSPAYSPEHLLRDSLLLKYGQRPSGLAAGDEPAVFPLRFGRRFWLASSHDLSDVTRAYMFCFDRKTDRSWLVKGGFDDDFYQTGLIPEWQAMDMYNRAYCFCKSGETVKQLSPSGSPVVFIVELKV